MRYDWEIYRTFFNETTETRSVKRTVFARARFLTTGKSGEEDGKEGS